MAEEDQDDEDEEFYDSVNEGGDEEMPQRFFKNKDVVLPEISLKSGSSHVQSVVENGLAAKRSLKDLHHNVIHD